MHVTSISEQRRHFRFQLEEPVRIQLQGDSTLVSGCLVNLSVGGAFIRCVTPVEPGRELRCAFMVPHAGSKEVVVCQGAVRWVATPEVLRASGPGFGVRFTKVEPKTAAFLEVVARDQQS